MNYLITPLHEHFDFGFGATGNAFKDAADRLAQVESENELRNLHLPRNFLYRHAVELFLKSAIVIFHRRLGLPYGGVPPDGDPRVRVNGVWRPFTAVHELATLWNYVRQLFGDHRDWLGSNTECDWTFPDDMDTLIAKVDAADPRSTFFRYPTLGKPSADVSKSVMVKADDPVVESFIEQGKKGKVFGLIVERAEGDVDGYYFDENAAADFGKTIRELADLLYGVHAALRFELCGGR